MTIKKGRGFKRPLGANVFEMAVDRMVKLYRDGHRVVVSFSGGKDSAVCLEICRLAAELTGCGPVEAIMRDEEIMFPGTFEYCKRVAQYPDVDFHWVSARQPITNVFNRANPYFWVFDPQLKPEEWVRQPPDFCEFIEPKCFELMVTTSSFPPAKGKDVFVVLGNRADESMMRTYGILNSKGYTTKKRIGGSRCARPIYDWADGDVWKAIKDNGWDYNRAYTTLHRFGIPPKNLRIAPPTLNASGCKILQTAAKAWPQWFSKVCRRLPGVRSVTLFGRRVCQPNRRPDETWEDCFHRECIENAPDWIAERSRVVEANMIRRHYQHGSEPFPQVRSCQVCGFRGLGSWKQLAKAMYGGDPLAIAAKEHLPILNPEFFREGAGKWGLSSSSQKGK